MGEIKIKCQDGTLLYSANTLKELGINITNGDTNFVKYPTYLVSRILYALSSNYPLLCYEMSTMKIFFQFVDCIRTLFNISKDNDNIKLIGIKWIDDLITLERWIQNFKMIIISGFTKTNNNKSATKIHLVFPWRPHIDSSYTYNESLNHPVKLAQHCYQFVFRCLFESLPGSKTGPVENRYFEFLYSKDKYATRAQVENIIELFIQHYKEYISKEGISNIIWNINKVDEPYFPSVKLGLNSSNEKRRIEF